MQHCTRGQIITTTLPKKCFCLSCRILFDTFKTTVKSVFNVFFICLFDGKILMKMCLTQQLISRPLEEWWFLEWYYHMFSSWPLIPPALRIHSKLPDVLAFNIDSPRNLMQHPRSDRKQNKDISLRKSITAPCSYCVNMYIETTITAPCSNHSSLLNTFSIRWISL